MNRQGFHWRNKNHLGIVVVGVVLAICLFAGLFKKTFNPSDVNVVSTQADLETVRKEEYDLGYTNGYNTAKKENEAAYRQGYETARKEVGSGMFTWAGMLGFLVGLCLSIGGFAALKRKELFERFREFRKQHELKKAFKTIPANLSPEIDAIAHQIARAYINVFEQLRDSKGYLVAQYAQQWRPRLQELMQSAVRLMELVRELETARASIDEQQLRNTITDLQRTVQNSQNDDATRNAAVKSLQRAKQTHKNLTKTQNNLEYCRASLQGINGVLESMFLKISNLNVNTQKTELLEELSSDLETEMCALEETLSEFTG